MHGVGGVIGGAAPRPSPQALRQEARPRRHPGGDVAPRWGFEGRLGRAVGGRARRDVRWHSTPARMGARSKALHSAREQRSWTARIVKNCSRGLVALLHDSVPRDGCPRRCTNDDATPATVDHAPKTRRRLRRKAVSRPRANPVAVFGASRVGAAHAHDGWR